MEAPSRARTPVPAVRGIPTAEQIATSNALRPELLIETVRSSATSGTGLDFRAHSAVSGGGSGVLVAPPAQRKDYMAKKTPPTAFTVSLPAGSGSASSSREPSGTSRETRHAPQTGVGTSSKTLRRIEELEQEIQFLRVKQEEELERERSKWVQRLNRSEEESQRRVAALEAERESAREEALSKARDFHAAILAEKKTAAGIEAELHEVRLEMASQAEASEETHAWKLKAAASAASLSEAERRCEDAARVATRSKQHAAEVERQRRELLKQSGVRACHELREELASAKSDRLELEKRLKKALPRIDRLVAEEQRLRASLTNESEAVAQHLNSIREESSELAKARDQLHRVRRAVKNQSEQNETLETEFAEAETLRRNAQVELSKSLRMQKEEQKRRQAAMAERDSLRQELEEMQERLQSSEALKPVQGGWIPVQRPSQEVRRLPPARSQQERSSSALQQVVQASGTESVPALNASSKLFEMIELAKERADQRRYLNDATEHVREQARELEELLAQAQDSSSGAGVLAST
eukprot:TRINITY_DN21092_c0_g2_i1.p1 TRINITY_DN21092_c0_g2~~TRINITY_DN21092_c0_g2_i1.p1  ORF type:complete len:593 (+),score=138.97 TRINITY_DN21092_c0_g2_i1:194-1780(+)